MAVVDVAEKGVASDGPIDRFFNGANIIMSVFGVIVLVFTGLQFGGLVLRSIGNYVERWRFL